MSQIIAFDTALNPGTIALVALVRSAVDSGLAFANAVVSERHLTEQLETETEPASLRILLAVARRDAVKASVEFDKAIKGLTKLGEHEKIQAINDEITSRTEYVRLNPVIPYPKAIVF